MDYNGFIQLEEENTFLDGVQCEVLVYLFHPPSVTALRVSSGQLTCDAHNLEDVAEGAVDHRVQDGVTNHASLVEHGARTMTQSVILLPYGIRQLRMASVIILSKWTSGFSDQSSTVDYG